ncbi:MAG: sirohydrochlorin chelatase [Alphaproteobacteria bacterium]
MSDKIGVMVCGHGSRDIEAIREFEAVARGIRERLPQYQVESGFLEFAQPIIRDGLDKLHAGKVREILAVPGMLFAAGHAKNDIPSVLATYEAKNPAIPIHYGRDLGIDGKLLAAAGAVGRGASDSDANSNVAKVMRMLWEGFGFGWAMVAYSGVTFPLVAPALEHAAKLGYRRVIVFPYFLFTGVLVKRIYDHTDQVAAAHPEIEFIKAPYLNDHPLVLDAFAARVEEILTGENKMNCKLCKYRDQILGFEAEVGLAQESHHHHVEGIGTGEEDSNGQGHEHDSDHAHGHHHGHGHEHGHDHGHGHGHDHGHHPYPHADHPLGPRTLAKMNKEPA